MVVYFANVFYPGFVLRLKRKFIYFLVVPLQIIVSGIYFSLQIFRLSHSAYILIDFPIVTPLSIKSSQVVKFFLLQRRIHLFLEHIFLIALLSKSKIDQTFTFGLTLFLIFEFPSLQTYLSVRAFPFCRGIHLAPVALACH